LADLNRKKSTNEQKLATSQQEIKAYQNNVDELQKIYQDLKNQKEDLKQQRSDIKNYANVKYALWQGNLYDKDYNNFLNAHLYRSYDKVIDRVDKNMALINNERTKYENKIYKTEGVIGQLKATINTLWRQIQNWID
jgi:prefoldin subunit 5